MIKSAKSWILRLSVGKAQEQQLVSWKDKKQIQKGAEEGGGVQREGGTGGGTAQPFGTQLASILAKETFLAFHHFLGKELQVLESHECSLSFHNNSVYYRSLWVWFDVLVIS